MGKNTHPPLLTFSCITGNNKPFRLPILHFLCFGNATSMTFSASGDTPKINNFFFFFFFFFGYLVRVWRWLPCFWNRPGHLSAAKQSLHCNQQPMPVPPWSPISFFLFVFSLWSFLLAPTFPALLFSPHVQQTLAVFFWWSSLSFFPCLPFLVFVHLRFFSPTTFASFFGSTTFPQLPISFCSLSLWSSFRSHRAELTKHSISAILFVIWC